MRSFKDIAAPSSEPLAPLIRVFSGDYSGDVISDDTAPLEAETKKKKPKKATLLTPASGRGLSGGDMSIKHKNLLGA